MRDLIIQVDGTIRPEIFWMVNLIVARLTWAQLQPVAAHPHVMSVELNSGGGPC